GATEVVGGLPLAARAVLALRVAEMAEPWIFAVGAARVRLEAALAGRGVSVRFIASPADLPVTSSALLIVPGDHLLDAAGGLRAPPCGAAAGGGGGAPRWGAAAGGGWVEDAAAGRPLADALRRAGSGPDPRPGDGLFVP